MEKKFIFDNLTHAQTAQTYLNSGKIRSRIIRISQNGCVHALSVNEKDFYAAKKILVARAVIFSVME